VPQKYCCDAAADTVLWRWWWQAKFSKKHSAKNSDLPNEDRMQKERQHNALTILFVSAIGQVGISIWRWVWMRACTDLHWFPALFITHPPTLCFNLMFHSELSWFRVRSENGGKLKMGKLLNTRDLGDCSSIQLSKEEVLSPLYWGLRNLSRCLVLNIHCSGYCWNKLHPLHNSYYLW
jgi:hypothetical protein